MDQPAFIYLPSPFPPSPLPPFPPHPRLCYMVAQMSISTIQSLQKIKLWIFSKTEAFQTLFFFNLCSSLVRGLLCLSKDKYTQRRCKCTEIRGGQQLFPDGQREHWHSERCPLKIDHSAEKLPVKKITIFHFFAFVLTLRV